MLGGVQGCPGELLALSTLGLRPWSWVLSPPSPLPQLYDKGVTGVRVPPDSLNKVRTHCDQL